MFTIVTNIVGMIFKLIILSCKINTRCWFH